MDKGYAVFTPTRADTAPRTGFVSLDGPREVADVRTEFAWLAAQPEVSDTQIGAWGISLGGGAAWNSVVAGVPFKALETFETWSDLYQRALPAEPRRSRARSSSSRRASRPTASTPRCAPYVPQLIGNENLPGVRTLLGARSSLRFMSDGDDAELPLPGPARLRLRHRPGGRRVPARSPDRSASTSATSATRRRRSRAPTSSHVLDLSTRWYDRFLKGMPNGVDTEKPVQVASRPVVGEDRELRGLPKTTAVDIRVERARRGARGSTGKVVAHVRPAEADRSSSSERRSSTVTARTASQWPHLVAVLTGVDARATRPSSAKAER